MRLPELSLNGKVAIVTGGGQGIGKATTLVLARCGAAVCIADIDPGPGEDVAAQIRAFGQGSMVLPVDVTSGEQVTRMVQKTIETFGHVDILVNNAGGATGPTFGIGRVLKISERDWDDTLALNLKSVFLCSRAVARSMMEQKKGCIINMATVT